jgi:ribosomal protein S12 methylthiotransferase
MEMVLSEARELVEDGVRELILVAQDTTYYGMDLYGEVRLAKLLRELEQVEGLDWIRLMYLYPINFTDELISVIADSSVIIPYLDMPLQHINSAVLKRMQRRVNGEQTRDLIGRLRDRIPNVVLRTTFITGFPGETDEQFEELRKFVEETRFERLGVFTYSLEPGTPAVRLEGHLPEEVKEARRDELMSLQQEIAFEHAERMVGYELDVLIDEEVGEGVYVGRTFADAPEIDSTVIVTGAELEPGDLVPVEILERDEYDLVGIVSFDDEDSEEAP